MPPQRRGTSPADQVFDAEEKLYRRVPPDCLSPLGELLPSQIGCSFGDTIGKSPSFVRSKYGSIDDTLHADCAGGNDVSRHLVFFIPVSELPTNVESGNKELYDFYPFHDPEDTCYAHTVIACKKKQNSSGNYDKPTDGVRNRLKTQFVSAFKNHRVR
jgi:hypothetical protein